MSTRSFGRHPYRTGFARPNIPGGPFVVDLESNLSVGALVPTPNSRGKIVNRIVLSLGQPFKRANGIFVHGYLGDGYRTASELFAEGWSSEQLLLLGDAQYSPTGDSPGMWSDSLVASTKRTKAYRALEGGK